MSHRFARNSLFSTVAGVSTALAGLVSSVVVARTLGVEGAGTVTFAIWMTSLMVAVVDLGAGPTLARYLPELASRRENDLMERLKVFVARPFAAATLLAFVSVALFAAWRWEQVPSTVRAHLDPRHSAGFWILAGLLGLLQAFAAFELAHLRGLQEFRRAAFLTIGSLALQVAGVTIGSANFGVVGALAGYCAGSLVPAFAGLRHTKGDSRIPPDLRRRVVRYASYAWAAGLASAFVWSRVEIFFLERSWGLESVGLFTVGLTLSNLAAQGPMLLTGGLLPYFSERFGRGDAASIRKAYATGTRVLAFLAFPACFGLAAVMPAVVSIVYGPAFAGASPAATVLVAAISMGAISSVGSHLVSGADRSDFVFVSGLVGAALSIATGLTLIPAFGLVGAAWARAGTQALLVGWGMFFITRRLDVPVPLGDLARLLAAAALCAAAARLTMELCSGVLALPLAISAGILVYGLLVRLLGALPQADVDQLGSLCGRLPGLLRSTTQRLLALVSGCRPVGLGSL